MFRVNSVNPGVIISNLHYRAGLTDEQYEEFLEHSKNTHALGRPGNPDEVAKCIAFFLHLPNLPFVREAVYQLSMLAVPHLTKTKGNIVNVSSVNGIRSFTGVLAYNMSKAALDQFTQCVALELAPKGIRVNSVNPGVILTDIHKRSGLTPEEYKQFLEKSKATHALGRTGSAEEVAQAIAFLASSNSSFCTGVLLPVDGGRHAMCPR
ncbi:unnamed protein product [Lepeophtheirus salmonis]|uniref:(salmon louse) hypothetical protein n=1 Tax=Lepeophtheirus salmonis TaxID=72036 RepID=A0A7R8CIR2_LEPSM|nr:unnamed protein product [Lepeophtheirus salmonis]CAF2797693.1 unnamed protein product [Lepeophtheirus salmonis]